MEIVHWSVGASIRLSGTVGVGCCCEVTQNPAGPLRHRLDRWDRFG